MVGVFNVSSAEVSAAFSASQCQLGRQLFARAALWGKRLLASKCCSFAINDFVQCLMHDLPCDCQIRNAHPSKEKTKATLKKIFPMKNYIEDQNMHCEVVEKKHFD